MGAHPSVSPSGERKRSAPPVFIPPIQTVLALALALAPRLRLDKRGVFAGGNVSTVNYQGPTGGLITAGEQCAYAIEVCLKRG